MCILFVCSPSVRLCVCSNNCRSLKLDSQQQFIENLYLFLPFSGEVLQFWAFKTSRDLLHLTVMCELLARVCVCTSIYVCNVVPHGVCSTEEPISFNHQTPPVSTLCTFWHLVALIAPLELELWKQWDVQLLICCFF